MQLIIDTLLRAADLMLVALGVSTVYALVRFPNLALPHYAMVGAFLALGLAALGAPLWAAGFAAVLLTGALALLLHRAVFARLLARGSAVAMIGSLAVAMILQAVVQVVAGTRSRRFDLPLEPPWRVLDAEVTSTQAGILLLTAAVVLGFFVLLHFTPLGRSMRAVAAQPALARASGVDSARVVDAICYLGGGFAALGGVLLALSSEAYHGLGQDLLLPVFTAAIIGGLGNPLGAVAGSLLLALIETLITSLNLGWIVGKPLAFLPLAYGPAVGFALLVLTLLTRPQGLLFRSVRRV